MDLKPFKKNYSGKKTSLSQIHTKSTNFRLSQHIVDN